jgi:hypothetical protein
VQKLDTVLIRPLARFTINNDSLCRLSNTSVQYVGGAATNASYNWNFDGANIISGSGQGPYSLRWASTGIKHISLTVTEHGVSSTQYMDSIYIKTLPQSSFTATSSILVTDSAT